MVRRRGYKVEMAPNNKQRTMLAKTAGCARLVWNWALSKKQEVYRSTGKNIGRFDLGPEWTRVGKDEFPYIREVSSYAIRSSLRNLDAAFKRFFMGMSGFPKKKTKRRGCGSFCFHGSRTQVSPNQIYLEKIGRVKLKRRGYIPVGVKVESVTVRERSGRWFVSVQVNEFHPIPLAIVGPKIGVDLGLITFAVTSEGEYIKSPRPLAAAIRKIRRMSRSHARKEPGSKNKKKSARKLGKLHYRIGNQRLNFIHQTTSKLTKTKSLIVVEGLDVGAMIKSGLLSRFIGDAGWGEFRRQLGYKCQWYGSKLVVGDQWFASTKTCHHCGNKQDLAIIDRIYNCPICGLCMCRDLNSAKNILGEGLKRVRSERPEFMPVEDGALAPPEKQELNVIAVRA